MVDAGEDRFESPWSAALRVLWLGYRTAAGNLRPLLSANLAIFLPVAVASLVAIGSALARNVAIINGKLQLGGMPSTPLLVVVAVILVLAGVATVVTFAANVFVAAGALLDSPVGWRAALRAALRRWPTLVGLLATGALVTVFIGAAFFATMLWPSRIWVGVTVAVVILLAVLRFSLALPLAVLEGRGTFAALGRAYLVSRSRTGQTVVIVLVGVWGVPILAELALRWALSPLDGLGHTAAWETLRGTLAVAILPFQAATLTVLGLRARASYEANQPAADLDRVAAHVPAQAGGSKRRVRPLPALGWAPLLVCGLLLPGLLYGGYLWANPLRLVVADRQEVAAEPEGEGPLTIYPGLELLGSHGGHGDGIRRPGDRAHRPR
ncbi:MAG: hypothetical protein GEV03_24800 [Streptosporangiales bacterium]|nr:hypothetical protein [Streptosporangiales bacterium]